MKVTGAPLPEAPDTQSAAVYLLTELRKWEKPYNYTDPLGLDDVGVTQPPPMSMAQYINWQNAMATPVDVSTVITVGFTLGGTLTPVSGQVAAGLYISPGTSSIGFYGNMALGAGYGISGSGTVTVGAYTNLNSFTGFAASPGGSYGEGVTGGFDLSINPITGTINGGAFSLGVGGGLTVGETHTLAGTTGVMPLTGEANVSIKNK